MRLPKGMEEGTFSLECPGGGRELEIEVRSSGRIKIDGKPYKSPLKKKTPSLKLDVDRSKPVVASEIPIEMELPFHKRTRFISLLLLIVFVLGLFSSFSTLVGSFYINDLEEKSPTKLVTLSVWIIDAGSGRALEDVSVHLESENGNHSATSDYQGLAVLENLTSGRMDLTIGKEGYKTVKSGVSLTKGSPNVIDIPLEEGDPQEEVPILVHQFEPKTYSSFITNVAASLMLLSSLMALISAFFVYRKEFFSLALFSAFLSIFSFGYLLGSLLAMLAVVLIILSYRGFSHTYTLLDMLDGLKRDEFKNLLKGEDRKLPGLPPVRKG